MDVTKYRLEVEYRVGRYDGGWYWTLSEFSEYGYYYQHVDNAKYLHTFRWTAILRGRLAARKRKTSYIKEFTI